MNQRRQQILKSLQGTKPQSGPYRVPKQPSFFQPIRERAASPLQQTGRDEGNIKPDLGTEFKEGAKRQHARKVRKHRERERSYYNYDPNAGVRTDNGYKTLARSSGYASPLQQTGRDEGSLKPSVGREFREGARRNKRRKQQLHLTEKAAALYHIAHGLQST
jgi:hypothetical protein